MEHNYEVRYEIYKKSMKDTFKQIPTTMTKPHNTKQKFHKLMMEIGGGWYM